jgi:putative hemolysin
MRSAMQPGVQPSTRKRAELFVKLAQSADEVISAQRLRYQVFTEEYGATLHTPVAGLDCDRFDVFCHHLIVINNVTGEVIATTRMLDDANTLRTGGFYSASEFDLTNINRLSGKKLEVGRTCVHKSFRAGATLALLWSGIAKFVLENQFDYLLGCGSISLLNGSTDAWSITRQLLESHSVSDALKVTPRKPLPAAACPENYHAPIPALIKAYTRLGASVGGEPCWDPDFQCADLFILLPIAALEARYARHFLKATA